MPTYEYACASCKNEWEEVQKISAPALEECPACKQKTAKRQISGGNFILKGGGWYADAYSSAKPSTSKKESDGSSSSAGDKSASAGSGEKGASESKPTETTKSEPATKTEKSESKGPTGGGGGSGGSGGSGGGGSGPPATRAA